MRRAFALLVAASIAAHVARLEAEAEETRANWSAEVDVVVITSRIRPGDEIDSHNTTTGSRPADHVPPGAVARRPDHVLVASQGMEPGEVLVESRTTEVESEITPGRRAMTVDVTAGVPDLRAGKHVDILGTLAGDPRSESGSEQDSAVREVATDAIILKAEAGREVGAGAGGTATLSVRASDVLTLGEANLNGAVVLVGRSG